MGWCQVHVLLRTVPTLTGFVCMCKAALCKQAVTNMLPVLQLWQDFLKFIRASVLAW